MDVLKGRVDRNSELSFVSVFAKKYCLTDDQENKPKDVSEQPIRRDVVIYSSKKPSKQLGTDKIFVPPSVVLNSFSVTHAGSIMNLACMLKNVQELDISMNAISQWQEVFTIIDCMPELSFLNLSNNPLGNSSPVAADQQISTCYNIRQLVLNGTKIPWTAVDQVLELMPQIFELHLSFNQYSTIELPIGKTYPSVTDVKLTSNEFSQWSEISKIGRAFPNLANLVLMSNPLTHIGETVVERMSGSDDGADQSNSMETSFCALKSLNISKTRIESWEELEKLHQLPQLSEVRLNGIEFLENTEEDLRRKLTVGYLPRVAKLNGSDISANERETANRAFIRYFMDRELKPARYFKLVDQIGQLDPLADVKLKPRDSVLLTVFYEDRSIVKRFRLNMTAGDVKQIIARELVGQPASTFDIYYNDVGGPYGHDKMAFLKRTLLAYHVKDDDEIHVTMKA